MIQRPEVILSIPKSTEAPTDQAETRSISSAEDQRHVITLAAINFPVLPEPGDEEFEELMAANCSGLSQGDLCLQLRSTVSPLSYQPLDSSPSAATDL